MGNKKEDELPMKGEFLDIPALYQKILETRNHFVHTTLYESMSLSLFRDIMVICQTLYKISIVMFDYYYVRVMGRSVIQDFTACIPYKDLELRYHVSSKFPNLVCSLSDDKLQKLFGEDICITRGSRQLTISYSDIQEFGVVFEY